MTEQQAQIVFYGVEALVLLFGLYGLGEWGLNLLARLKAGTLKLDKAQNRFSLAALLLGFMPVAVAALAFRLQPFGDVMIFKDSEAHVVGVLLAMLMLGFVAQTGSIGTFWFLSRKYK